MSSSTDHVTLSTSVAFVFSLGEEIRLSSCTSSLRAKNDDLIDSLGRINAVLKQMDVYLTMLSEQSKPVVQW